MTKISIIIVICLFFLSCKGKVKETGEIFNEEQVIPVIHLEKALDILSNDRINFSEFTDNITYVPLETNNDVIIGSKREPPINITENYIFYGEMMFRRDGSFVRKLGSVGQGPGEYLLPLSIVVDENREEFCVLDNFTHDIYIYDFSNNFKKQLKTDQAVVGMRGLGNGKVILSQESYHNRPDELFEYKVFDLESGSALYTRYQIRKERHANCMRNNMWRYNEDLFYYEGMTDTIFSLTKDGEINAPRYIIEKGKYACDYEDVYVVPDEAQNKKIVSIGGIAESKSYLFFSISIDRSLYYAAYNKTTGEMQASEFSRFFNNDIDGGLLWLFNNVGNGNEGYDSVLPHVAQERIENLSKENKGYDKEKNRQLKQLLDNVDEDDNHIFYFFHLK